MGLSVLVTKVDFSKKLWFQCCSTGLPIYNVHQPVHSLFAVLSVCDPYSVAHLLYADALTEIALGKTHGLVFSNHKIGLSTTKAFCCCKIGRV